ncbi:Hypothetical predicted protein [Cloeon dipterum]|uniref:Uncharacterized protein n=1 Tax=Cloeon dipterum TaxID=197152 RepID=A0A8S1DU22_9INSE|nr:Hypothetical predicted protein [Cloeon dipterum]
MKRGTCGSQTEMAAHSFDLAKRAELLQFLIRKSKEECNNILANINRSDTLENPLHFSQLVKCVGEDNLYEIYDKVTKDKVKTCFERENGSNKEVSEEEIEQTLHSLRLISSLYIRKTRRVEQVVGSGVKREDLERLNDLEIATCVDGEVSFTHETFAEFLTAQKFVKDIQDSVALPV